MDGERVLRKLIRAWLYFKHGYGEYFTYPISLAEKILIFLIALRIFEVDGLSGLGALLATITGLGLLAALITLIGRWDYWKGQVPEAVYINPYQQDMIRALLNHFQGDDERAIKLLEKWRDK